MNNSGNDVALVMPRRLAITILHEAQIAQPAAIHGWILAQADKPVAYRHGEAQAGGVWARLWSNPLSPAVPTAEQLSAGGLHLLVSLNIKGVLEMRAWELCDEMPRERVLKILD